MLTLFKEWTIDLQFCSLSTLLWPIYCRERFDRYHWHFTRLPYLLSSSLHTACFLVCETDQDIVPPFSHPLTLCLVLFYHCNLFLSRLYSFTLIFLPCHLFLRIFVKISVKFATFLLPSDGIICFKWSHARFPHTKVFFQKWVKNGSHHPGFMNTSFCT